MRRFLVFAIVLGLASVMPAATASAVDLPTFVRVTGHSDLVGMTEDGGGLYEGTYTASTFDGLVDRGALTATIYSSADGGTYHGYGVLTGNDGATVVEIDGRLLYVVEDDESFTLVYRERMTIVDADNGVFGRGAGIAYVTVSDDGVHVQEHIKMAVRYPH